jgi:putative ABC transport system permease protein
MLQLKNILKDYVSEDNTVHALKGITLSFRQSEFVSILGQSGCGKTTLLNIIGGLDRYTDGDLIIDGVSTKNYKDRDWDNYRNHKIGFIFQSYNLIPHQTVLGNVELALTLSGVSKAERRQRAIDALNKVGLGNQLKKRPNQLSGGQMQRVAIARAIVNNPTIILADEPTGALDTATSVQVMDILKEISKDRLVIMVTHNPDLAKEYSTRIVKLADGLLEGDNNPYEPSIEEVSKTLNKETINNENKPKKAQKKARMSLKTAFGLSFRNLLTKKARTFLTAFAGSIGIIGIALILSMSSGFQVYINNVQEDTLSSYPLTLQKTSVDLSKVMRMNNDLHVQGNPGENQVGVTDSLKSTLANSSSSTKENDLVGFKKFLENENIEDEKLKKARKDILEGSTSIQYSYDMNVYAYYKYTDPSTHTDSYLQVNPSSVTSSAASSVMGTGVSSSLLSMMGIDSNMFGELLPNVDGSGLYNEDLLSSQYDLVSGKLPTSYNEALFVLDDKGNITDYSYYGLGLGGNFTELIANKDQPIVNREVEPINYSDILNLSYKLVLPSSLYEESEDRSVVYDGETYKLYDNKLETKGIIDVYNEGIDLKVVGIIKKKENIAASSISTPIVYSPLLTQELIKQNKLTKFYVEQEKLKDDISLITGLPFVTDGLSSKEKAQYYLNTLSSEERALKEQDFNNKAIKNYFKNSITDTLNKIAGNGLGNINLESLQFMYTTDGNNELYTDYHSLDDFYNAVYDVGTLSSFKEKYVDGNSPKYLALVATFSGVPGGKPLSIPMPIKEAYNAGEEYAYSQYYKNELAQYTTYSALEEDLEVCSLDEPSAISIYPKSFQDKDNIVSAIDVYNTYHTEQPITYTDYVGVMMSSISTILNAVTYVLIGFVSISLIVSSIMIAIITYISVLERTKEIGILRSLGASKSDVSNIFNAETIFIGLLSGVIGVVFCVIIDIPINLIINSLAQIGNVAVLPWQGGLILIIISILLSFIAGLIPSRIASTRDPVIALRSE